MTETRPEAHLGAPEGHDPIVGDARDLGGVTDWLTSGDHTKVGRLFMLSSLLFGVGALVAAALVALERIDPTSIDLFDRATDAEQVTHLSVWALMVLCVLPLLAGLAIAVVPLQVGARSIAFPRAAAFSYWMWLVASVLLVGSVLANGGPGGGEPDAVDLYLVALGALLIALVLAAVCIATTVLTHRAPGMRLDRVPMFAWSMLVQSVMILAVLPAVMAVVILLYVDHRYGRILGGNKGIVAPLNWAVRAPTTGLMTIPALGLVAEVLPVMTRVRQNLPGMLRAGIALAGLVSFGAFAQDWVFEDVTTKLVFVLVCLAGVLGPVIVLGVSGMGLRMGKPALRAPFVWAMLLGLLALGVGAMGALLPFKDLHLLGTAYEQGQFDAAAAVGLLTGLAGLIYWGPKLWGRMLADGPALGLALLGALGVLLVAVPSAVAGFIDQPRYTVAFSDKDATGLLNGLAVAGYAVLALVVLAVVGLLAKSVLGGGESAGNDPWDGHTLEWSTSSPPPPGNFDGRLPVVASDRPLLDAREVS